MGEKHIQSSHNLYCGTAQGMWVLNMETILSTISTRTFIPPVGMNEGLRHTKSESSVLVMFNGI